MDLFKLCIQSYQQAQRICKFTTQLQLPPKYFAQYRKFTIEYSPTRHELQALVDRKKLDEAGTAFLDDNIQKEKKFLSLKDPPKDAVNFMLKTYAVIFLLFF